MRLNRKVNISKHFRLVDGKRLYCRPVLDYKCKVVPESKSLCMPSFVYENLGSQRIYGW